MSLRIDIRLTCDCCGEVREDYETRSMMANDACRKLRREAEADGWVRLMSRPGTPARHFCAACLKKGVPAQLLSPPWPAARPPHANPPPEEVSNADVGSGHEKDA